jgi:phage terminase large subunit-like protein
VLTWAMSNVTAKVDAKENIYPRKEKPQNKIDPVVALIMALARAMAAEEEGGSGSVYEERGVLVF